MRSAMSAHVGGTRGPELVADRDGITQHGRRGDVGEGVVVERLDALGHPHRTEELDASSVQVARDCTHSASRTNTGQACSAAKSWSPLANTYCAKA